MTYKNLPKIRACKSENFLFFGPILSADFLMLFYGANPSQTQLKLLNIYAKVKSFFYLTKKVEFFFRKSLKVKRGHAASDNFLGADCTDKRGLIICHAGRDIFFIRR